MHWIHCFQDSNSTILLGKLEAPKVTKSDLKKELQLALRSHFKDTDLEIVAENSGKPLLVSPQNHSISVSYAPPFAAFYAHRSATRLGIDVERLNDKIIPAKHIFLNENEQTKFTTLLEIQLCWSAKEAIYKFFGERQLNFKAEIEILAIHPSNSTIEILIYRSFLIKAEFLCLDDLICVWI